VSPYLLGANLTRNGIQALFHKDKEMSEKTKEEKEAEKEAEVKAKKEADAAKEAEAVRKVVEDAAAKHKASQDKLREEK